jgi:hypothetical protein
MNTVSLSAPRSRRWPWMLLALMLLAMAALALAWGAVSALNPVPFRVVVDGQQVFDGIDLASMPPAHKVVLAAVLAFVMLAALPRRAGRRRTPDARAAARPAGRGLARAADRGRGAQRPGGRASWWPSTGPTSSSWTSACRA